MRTGTVSVLVAVVVLLAGVGIYAYVGLINGGDPLPTDGKIALMAGAFFSIIVGCGLMALLFYSSRHGYDEPPHYRE
jgi:Kef-type K+ transport system membrane component KefB